MKRIVILTVVGLALATSIANAELIAYWHFNDVTTGVGTLSRINGFGTTTNMLEYAKDTGSGTYAGISAWNDGDTTVGTLYGSNGGGSTDNFGATTGTTVNATAGANAGYALQIAGDDNNNNYFIIELDDAIESCVLTYASSRSASGHAQQNIAYSIDGGSSWTSWGNITPQSGTTGPSWGLVTVNFGDVFKNTWGSEKNLIRITVTEVPQGAAYPNNGSSYFDNIQINGDIVPEPMTMAFLALGSVGLLITGKARRDRVR